MMQSFRWINLNFSQMRCLKNENVRMNAWRVTDGCMTCDWWVHDGCMMGAWHVTDGCMMGAWWVHDMWPMGAWWVHDMWPMGAWWVHDVWLMDAWWVHDMWPMVCMMGNRLVPHFLNYFSTLINDVIIEMNKYEFLSDDMFEEWKS
jgi:hypothetical protein